MNQSRFRSTGVRISERHSDDHVLDHIVLNLIHEKWDEAKPDIFNLSRFYYDQHDTNICVACSVVYLKSVQDGVTTLNPFFIYNLRQQQSNDTGMSVRDALSLLHRYGCAETKIYPIQQVVISTKEHVHQLSHEVLENAHLHRIKMFGRVHNAETAIHLLQLSMIHGSQCFSGAIVVLPLWSGNQAWWRKPTNVSSNIQPNSYHCVVLSSYDLEKRCFQVQNWWGVEFHQESQQLQLEEWNQSVVECWFHTSSDHVAERLRELSSRKSKDGFTSVGEGNDNYEASRNIRSIDNINGELSQTFGKKIVHDLIEGSKRPKEKSSIKHHYRTNLNRNNVVNIVMQTSSKIVNKLMTFLLNKRS